MKCRRLQLFEFEDQQWFPHLLRKYITDYLRYWVELLGLYKPIIAMIREIIIKTDHFQVIDLCSGSGGPIIKIQQALKQDGLLVQVVLTDKFPNQDIKAEYQDTNITWVKESVDAMSVPIHLNSGMRTIFSSFHHFNPTQAKNILQDAIHSNFPIGVFEFTERSLFSLLCALLVIPLFVLLFSVFIKPFTLGRFFWTYIIPIVPLICLWDGCVSNLRAYTPGELIKIVKQIEDYQKYHWKIGKIQSKICNVTYLLGYPLEYEAMSSMLSSFDSFGFINISQK